MFSGLCHWLRGFSSPSSSRLASKGRLLLEQLEDRDVPSTLLGNQIFPSDNPWNQRVDKAPVSSMSATWVNSIGLGSPLHPDFGAGVYAGASMGIPYNVVSGTQPKLKVIIDAYPGESDIVPVPIPDNAKIEGDPMTTGDRHLIVYDKDNNIVYELYHAKPPSLTGDGFWHADSQAVWDLSKNTFRTPGYTSADAAGLPILPGLIRTDEVLTQKRIDHAIRFTVPRSLNSYVYPASHHAGRADNTLPPMGARFRLKSSFDISGFSPANQVILRALKEYGMIVADNGSSWFIGGESSPLWNNDDLHNLKKIFGSSFEAVDLKPIVSGLSATAGPSGTTLTISGLNFSGGAGQTKVFFGATAVSSFTIHADNSITAVVPTGTIGTTVNVTVRSPYGTSTTSASTQFTFQQQTTTTTPPVTENPLPEDTQEPTPPPVVNPGTFFFSNASYSTLESAGTIRLSVVRANGSDGQVTVPFTLSSTVLSPNGGTITFASGQTSQDIVLSIYNDSTLNGDRSFMVTLGQPSSGTLGLLYSTKVTVVDDEKGSAGILQYGAARYYVSEGAPMAAITVTRTGGASGRVTVQYYTQNGTARAGYDYRSTRGTLVFEDGETTKTFYIPIINNYSVEPDETIRLYLSSATGGAALGTRKTATAIIVDNDSLTAAVVGTTSTNTSSAAADALLLATYELYWPWKNRKV